jgi:1,4-alpha-glucan branching enzyme
MISLPVPVTLPSNERVAEPSNVSDAPEEERHDHHEAEHDDRDRAGLLARRPNDLVEFDARSSTNFHKPRPYSDTGEGQKSSTKRAGEHRPTHRSACSPLSQ